MIFLNSSCRAIRLQLLFYSKKIDKDLFRAAKTATNKAITLAKSTYVRDTIATNKGNSKDLWKILNRLSKSAISTSTLPEHSQKSELAENFNMFFLSKRSKKYPRIWIKMISLKSHLLSQRHKSQF